MNKQYDKPQINHNYPQEGIVYVIPSTVIKQRLDKYCQQIFSEIPSIKSAYKRIKANEILLDGKPAQPNWQVKAGDRLELLPTTKLLPPVLEFNLNVIFEDQYLAVVEKPAGIAVSGNYAHTIERALPWNLESSVEGDTLPYPRPVHRLDSATSGLLLCAKTASCMVALGRLFQQKRVYKRYRGIVVGSLKGGGFVRSKIDNRLAESRYKSIAITPSLSYTTLTVVDLFPHTGRTHQLRRHMAELGHPIIGDSIYGKTGKVLKSKGLFLRAVEIRFIHPITNKPINIKIEQPTKFATYIAREKNRYFKYKNNPMKEK